jgi:hypothetical protein
MSASDHLNKSQWDTRWDNQLFSITGNKEKFSGEGHMWGSEYAENKIFDPIQRWARKGGEWPHEALADIVSGNNNSVKRHMRDALYESGAPEQVTVYRKGDSPDNYEFNNGSVDPNWPKTMSEAGKLWRGINHGKLHIHVIPQDDLVATGNFGESEVFFKTTPRASKVACPTCKLPKKKTK